jgi:outer membrane protein assembly factor BamD (BamD/ComL family)
MRKFLVLTIIVAVVAVWCKGFVRSGRMDDYLDRHPNPQLNAPLEYYWGVLLELVSHTSSAEYRFERVQDKYPKSEYAPLAWSEIIEMLDGQGKHDQVVLEGKKFLVTYPQHPKAELIRRKIAVIEDGY